jgi:DNA-binding response OmpR family regulator
MRIIQVAKTVAAGRAGRMPPVILLAGDPQARTKGKEAGADEALATPPSYGELQAAVIRTLSRPAAIASRPGEEAPPED